MKFLLMILVASSQISMGQDLETRAWAVLSSGKDYQHQGLQMNAA